MILTGGAAALLIDLGGVGGKGSRRHAADLAHMGNIATKPTTGLASTLV